MAVYDDQEKNNVENASRLSDLESAATSQKNDGPEGDERRFTDNDGDTVGKGFTGGDKSKSFKGRISKKKASIIGVLTGGLVGGGLFGFGVIHGPMELATLGQTLQIFDYKSTNSVNIRAGGWYRFAQTGEYGETRVGAWGSKLVNDRREKLSKVGIDFDGDNLSNIRSISFDTEKLGKERLVGLQGRNFEDSRRVLAQEFNLPEEDFRRVGTRGADGHRIVIVARGENVTKIRDTVTKVVGDPDNTGIIKGSKAYNAMTHRAFKKFYNLPSLFSPIKRNAADKGRDLGTAMDRNERKKREKERMQRITAAAESVNPGARQKLSEKLSGNTGKFAGGALITTGGMCFVRDIAEDVVEANRAAVVIPTILDATDKKAVGSQVQSNIDIDMDSAGDVAESLKDDEGKTIWQGTAMQSISSNNFNFDANKNDPNDLSPDYKQAFSNKTTSSDIKDTFGGGGVGDLACSTPGQIIQVTAGLGLIIAGPFTGGGSWAAFAAKTGAGAAATAGVMYLLKEKITTLLSKDPIDMVDSIPAPVRGNLLAYGAREAANTAARSNGGIELSKEESDAADREVINVMKTEFKDKRLATQLFDISDYRSVASQASMSLSPSITQNVSAVASGLFNVKGSFSSIASALTPKTVADERSLYSWDFNIFGIPEKILTDKKYEDPYKNADIVSKFLTEWPLDTYKDRVKDCFGITLSNESGPWDVIPENEVNPNSQKYLDANCSDIDEEMWVRIMLFIFDNRYMSAAACLELNDEDACNKVDSSYGIAQDASSTTSTASETFDVALLDGNSEHIACAPNTKEIRNDDGYRAGKKIKVKLCEIPNLPQATGFGSHNGHATTNSVVSGAVYAMVEAAKKDGVEMSAISTYRSMADQRSLCPCDGVRVGRPGYSNHQLGVAIDFGRAGTFMDANNPMWKWLDKNADKFGYKPYTAEAWHWSPFGS